jgi:hypothetical protein
MDVKERIVAVIGSMEIMGDGFCPFPSSEGVFSLQGIVF